MSKKRKRHVHVPEPTSEDEEREFWAENEVVDYFDWDKSV